MPGNCRLGVINYICRTLFRVSVAEMSAAALTECYLIAARNLRAAGSVVSTSVASVSVIDYRPFAYLDFVPVVRYFGFRPALKTSLRLSTKVLAVLSPVFALRLPMPSSCRKVLCHRVITRNLDAFRQFGDMNHFVHV
jgi:hypothetical protein